MTQILLAILAHPDDESFGPGGTLARYAQEGVAVHICIATDGAAGSIAEGHDAERDNLATVRAGELERAVEILGGTLHRLGYRDSGMSGDPANEHLDAWINSDDHEAVGRVVALIRQLKPDVILTHNEQGDYFHPDHIRCYEVVTQAVKAAADADQYQDAGEPHQIERLYVTAFSSRWIKIIIFLIRLRRKDPTKMGRNEDIDFTRLGYEPSEITTKVDMRSVWDVKRKASAEHASQGGGGSRFRFIPGPLQKRLFGEESFIRLYPPFESRDGGEQEAGFFS